jgi:LmbE family N-acetylglucosaminyl deacetylase
LTLHALAAIVAKEPLWPPGGQLRAEAAAVAPAHAGGAGGVAVAPQTAGVLKLAPTTRLLVVAPHPDDEVIGAGGAMRRAVESGIPVHVVFVTSGDGYPDTLLTSLRLRHPTGRAYVEMGEIRQREALRALESLGVSPDEVSFLGFPDGGLAGLWTDHWTLPYSSPFTRHERPPYREALDQSAEYDGTALVSLLERVMRDFAPTLILIPHPSDAHPDHATAGNFAIEAVDNLQEEGSLRRDTEVLTYLVHHGMWPDSSPGRMELVPPRREWVADTDWLTFPLSEEERREKEAALRAYETQMEVMPRFLLLFARRNELFGELRPTVQKQIADAH